MWTRLGTHHASRGEGGGRGEDRGARGMRWDGTQRVHNGYVRQGWILLINPTGYIVPSARDGHTPLHPTPPRSRSNEDGPLRRCASATQLRSSTSYSPPFPRAARERYPFVGMSCVAEYQRRWCASLLYHSHYACLRQRRYRSAVPRDVPRVPFPPFEKERRRCRNVEAGRNWTCRSGELP